MTVATIERLGLDPAELLTAVGSTKEGDAEGKDRLLHSLEACPAVPAARVERMRHRGGRDLRRSVAYRAALGDLARLA